MLQPESPLPELEQLALGYALGELDHHELERLYALLTQGEQGPALAQATWEALRGRVEMRSVLDPLFPAQVIDRLDAANDDDSDGGGFLAGVLGGLGMGRRRLSSVRLSRVRSPRRWPYGLLALIVVALVALVLWPLPHQHGPLVQAVEGRVVCDGVVLRSGQPLASGIVVLASGDRLTLSWSENAQVLIQGPAAVSADGSGLSLHSGRVDIRTHQQPLRLGLPAFPAVIGTNSRVIAEAGNPRSLIACELGSATVGTELQLSPGETSDGLRRGLWWQSRDGSAHPSWPRPAVGWSCVFSYSFHDDEQRLTLLAQEQALLHIQAKTLLAADGAEYPLAAAAPRRPRVALLQSHGDGQALLRLDEQELILPWPSDQGPQWETSTGTNLQIKVVQTGPGQ